MIRIFRQTIAVKDGQQIDMLSVDDGGDLALKATDHPVVLNREQGARLIDALAEAFDLPLRAVSQIDRTKTYAL
jgi:hypothetical protein